MDDDVKNLFQKFGQSAAGYQEINRQAEMEQAKQRWPLLRDVRVHALPEPEADEVALAEPVVRPALRTLPSVAIAVAAVHAEPFMRSVAPAAVPVQASAPAPAQAPAPSAKAGSLASVFTRLAKPNLPVQNQPAVSSFFKKIFQS